MYKPKVMKEGKAGNRLTDVQAIEIGARNVGCLVTKICKSRVMLAVQTDDK